jgi:chloramphenicol 3-O-phosphotransferase
LAAEPKDARAGIFVISGTQGAGKTTVAVLLATRFERAAHVSADTLQKMIVSGGKWPSGRDAADDDGARQLRLRLRNACLLARSFREAGITAIIDDIVIGGRLADLLEHMEGEPFMFVMLAPDKESVRLHERERGTRLYEEWEWLTDEAMNTRRVGLWIDNSRQAPDETVDEIMRRAWDEANVTAPPVSQR